MIEYGFYYDSVHSQVCNTMGSQSANPKSTYLVFERALHMHLMYLLHEVFMYVYVLFDAFVHVYLVFVTIYARIVGARNI